MSDEENTEVIQLAPGLAAALAPPEESTDTRAVSYTHLTLPTILRV